MEPSEGALHHPAVLCEGLARPDPASGDARPDGAGAAFGPAAAVLAGLVRMRRPGPLARPAAAVAHGPGTASSVAASLMVSCRSAGPGRTPSGVPRRSSTTWRLKPGSARDPSGSARSRRPPSCRHRGAVEASAAPVRLAGVREPLEKRAVEPGPDARLPPIAQPAPTGHPRAPHLARAPPPKGCRSASHDDDASQDRVVIAPRSAALGPGPLPREQGLNGRPQPVGYKRLVIAPQHTSRRSVWCFKSGSCQGRDGSLYSSALFEVRFGISGTLGPQKPKLRPPSVRLICSAMYRSRSLRRHSWSLQRRTSQRRDVPGECGVSRAGALRQRSGHASLGEEPD